MTAPTTTSPSFWTTSTFRWGLLSAVAIWLAFPPVAFWPLAWVAPLGWLRLVRTTQLDGRRPYVLLYLVAWFHWLLMTQWVRLPHWSAGIGWFFLASYLALYVPLFVGISRWLVHRGGVSPVFAAPTVWVALELARGHLFTGFSIALLSHSQASVPPLLQISSLTGAYGVSFLVVLVAAAVERSISWQAARRSPRVWWPLGVASGAVSMAIGYGVWTLQDRPVAGGENASKVALIQGAFDTEFDGDPSRPQKAFEEYRELSQQAVTNHRDLDLVIWPESMFSFGRSIIRYDDNLAAPENWEGYYSIEDTARICEMQASQTVREIGTACLMGTDSLYFRADGTRRFNTAAHYRADGKLRNVYHKMHPVMFGEYVPLGDVFPWLYKLTPMPSGLSRGEAPVSFQAGGHWFSPCICFENTVPHLLRRQLATLRKQGKEVDVLVTITNDGWFWGSSLLDLHLACGVFRAIEHRKPMLISANTGFSAWVDQCGRVVRKGPRRASGVIVANVEGDFSETTLYAAYGDWFAGICLLFTLAGIVYGRTQPGSKPGNTVERHPAKIDTL